MHAPFQIFNMLPLNICIRITKHIKICLAYFSPFLSSTKIIKQLKSGIRELKLKSLPIFWKTFCTTNQPLFLLPITISYSFLAFSRSKLREVIVFLKSLYFNMSFSKSIWTSNHTHVIRYLNHQNHYYIPFPFCHKTKVCSCLKNRFIIGWGGKTI